MSRKASKQTPLDAISNASTGVRTSSSMPTTRTIPVKTFAKSPMRVEVAPHEIIPSIYNIISTGQTRNNDLVEELNDFLSASRYCSRMLGKGSFGRVDDRSAMLMQKPEVLFGHHVVFNRLVDKEVIVKYAAREPENEMMTHPFYFSVEKHGKLTVVDTDNNPGVTGLAGEVFSNMLCTELFRRVSPHFTYMADFSFCGDTFQYYFENLGFDFTYKSGRVGNMTTVQQHWWMWFEDKVPITDDMLSGMLISVFHSLHLMRKNFAMNHFDLHIGNVYVKVFDNDKYFAGRNMLAVKYFCYHVNKREFWVQNPGYIIKIGDLGMTEFTLGNTRFTNTYARTLRNPEQFEPYHKKNSGEHPDFLLFLSYMMSRFIGSYPVLDKIRQKVHPLNSCDGIVPENLFDEGFTIPDVLKIPRLIDVICNLGIFDNLTKRPKVAEEHVCHVYDTVIVDQLL